MGVLLETTVLRVLEAAVTVTVTAGAVMGRGAGMVFAKTAMVLRRAVVKIDRLVAMMDGISSIDVALVVDWMVLAAFSISNTGLTFLYLSDQHIERSSFAFDRIIWNVVGLMVRLVGCVLLVCVLSSYACC